MAFGVLFFGGDWRPGFVPTLAPMAGSERWAPVEEFKSGNESRIFAGKTDRIGQSRGIVENERNCARSFGGRVFI
jgi:hypothetical protein